MWLNKIIEGSAKNQFVILIFIFLLAFGGIWGIINTPLDAIPDLSDLQVIIFTKWQGQSPDLIEDQITYPIVSSLLAAPKVKAVRGISMFGFSFVYVIFDDDTDLYWARSRILEYMDEAKAQLPKGVTPTLGPDATGVGWGFEYALVDESNTLSIEEIRTFQDWYLRFWLKSVPGVSDVASIGGFVKQYQITIDPDILLQYKIPIKRVIKAIRMSNKEVGGRVVEFSGREYMVRGRGYVKNLNDLKKVVISHDMGGSPLYLEDVANIAFGPDIRRGMADLDGKGEVVGGIVVIRFGEDTLSVIKRVKQKIKGIEASLPKGLKLVVTYDRSELIERSIETLVEKLIEESLIVSVVCVVFLFHFRSALVAVITLPLAIIFSFLIMHYIGLSSNIMSLGGIAIAIGAMVDSAIVMIENAHKHLEHPKPGASREDTLLEAAKEVGRPLFFALLIITVSFLPIFSLEGQAGKLFHPLAYTKSFAMFFAALLSITLVPILMVWFIRGKITPEHKNPVNRFLIWAYNPIAKFCIHNRKLVILFGVLVMATIPWATSYLDSEFMPPLDEGTIMYMPVTVSGISIEEARKLLKIQDEILFKKFPKEVKRVFGKVGRATTATDPAPVSMTETVVELYPKDQWREGYDLERLKREMDMALSFPGVFNSWTQPIQGRIDMLSTGIRTVLGIKIFGNDQKKLEAVGIQMEKVLKRVRGTKNAYTERIAEGGQFIDFTMKREEIARHGLTVQDVQSTIQTAIGGMNISGTIEGRERFPINVRYPREKRNSIKDLEKVLINTPGGYKVTLSKVADLKIVSGPALIKSEDGQLVQIVFVNIEDRAIGSYVKEADKLLRKEIKLPPGFTYRFSGQFENLERAMKRLFIVLPLTLVLVIILLYFNIRSPVKIAIVLLAVPFSLVGSFWILVYLDYNISVAVWVGIIALAGLDAETGVVMLLYLDIAYDDWMKEGKINSVSDIELAALEGSVKRVRPKIMTMAVILFGLLPIMWSDATGSDVMKRIAAPMVGGVITSSIFGLLVYPAIYVWWREQKFKKKASV